MKDQEGLRKDIQMFDEAIKDLAGNGGDPEVIKSLEKRKLNTAQVINFIPRAKIKDKGFFHKP